MKADRVSVNKGEALQVFPSRIQCGFCLWQFVFSMPMQSSEVPPEQGRTWYLGELTGGGLGLSKGAGNDLGLVLMVIASVESPSWSLPREAHS